MTYESTSSGPPRSSSSGLEPEEEAGIALPAAAQGHPLDRGKAPRIFAVAPFTTNGLRKLKATVVRTAPGAEVAAIEQLAHDGELALDGGGVILVGERLAADPRRAARRRGRWPTQTGARLAWVPAPRRRPGRARRRLPRRLLPGGRPVADAAARVDVSHRVGRRGAAPRGPRRRRDPGRRRGRRARRAGRRRRRARRPGRPGRRRGRARRGRLRGQPRAARERGHRARRRRAAGRPGGGEVRQLRDLGGPGAALRQGARREQRRCPTCGCWPASPTSSAARSASRRPQGAAAELDELGPWDGARVDADLEALVAAAPADSGSGLPAGDLEDDGLRRPDAGRRRGLPRQRPRARSPSSTSAPCPPSASPRASRSRCRPSAAR